MNVKEALKVLDKAAVDGGEDFKDLVSSDYQHLFNAIIKSAPHLVWDKVKQVKEVAVDYTVDKAKEVDHSVHQNAWTYIGGAAVVAGAIGFLLGRSMK